MKKKLKENKKTLKNEIDIAPFIPALEVMLERGILGDKVLTQFYFIFLNLFFSFYNFFLLFIIFCKKKF